ncbi:hypothetical protein CBR_g41546 [Chara braunii]|uniref:Integrase catalytic domain-containing protein n=1 Tax=Chara braunii TaxID=69332 RepID=A0A388K2U8_CHABU|nr:hypothetical protein CBR_g41546 [Chara braunii]|eukprot:GBG64345.1 hypothetical protein CBR_g41546 [Chara braunii]
MKKVQQEEEERRKAAEAEAAAEEEKERMRIGSGEGSSSGTMKWEADPELEKKISEWVANLSLGEDEEAESYVTRDEKAALAAELAAMTDPMERREREDEQKLAWKLRMKREKKRRREEVNKMTAAVAKVQECRAEVLAQPDHKAKWDKWRSAKALKSTMDDLVAVPDHGVAEPQLVQLFYRAIPEALRGHFFDKSQQAGITYDALSREVVLYESKSMPVTTFWHKDLEKGKKWKDHTISGQVKAKDHLIQALEEGGTEEVPYDQIEWGLGEEDSSVGQGRSYVAVAAGGRPQVVYLDDILVFSKTLQEHQGHLRQVLEKLREANFKINAKKCEWAKTQVLYLGHILDGDGVKPEESKIAAIRDWPTPRTLTELRSFLGLANYYRKFVRNFSTIAAPLRRLLKKETIWQWDKDCTSALKKLKRALIEYPVLKVADPSLPFVVTTDASQYGIGAVLQQDDDNGYRPIEFMSARMPCEKVATSTYERELYALRQALDHWKHYLLGRHFKVYSDHETLRWLKTEAKMTPKLTRWAAEIDQFDFELKPVKGKYNVVADALSRRLDYFGAVVHYLDIGRDLQEKVKQAYMEDPIYSDLLKRVREALETEPDYRTTDGLLFEKTNVFDRLCVPNSEEIRSLILGECHDTEGHFGWQKTLTNLMRAYTWPGMKNDCIEYVRSCKVCQRNKSTTRAPLGLLRPLPNPDQLGDSVSIDFMDMQVKSRHGKSQVMVIVDRFTGLALSDIFLGEDGGDDGVVSADGEVLPVEVRAPDYEGVNHVEEFLLVGGVIHLRGKELLACEGDGVFARWSLGVSGRVLDGGGLGGVAREMLGQYGSDGKVGGVSGDIEMASGVGDFEDRGRGDGLLDDGGGVFGVDVVEKAGAGGAGGGLVLGVEESIVMKHAREEVSKGHVGFVGEGGCKVFVAYSFDAGDERKVGNDGVGEVVAEGANVLDEAVRGTGLAEVAELFKVVVNGFLGAEGGSGKVGPLEEGVTWSSGGSTVANFSHPPFGCIVEEAGGGNGEPVGKGHVVEVKRVLKLGGVLDAQDEGGGGGSGTVVEVEGLVDVVVEVVGVEEVGGGVLMEAAMEEGVVCTVEDGVVCAVEEGVVCAVVTRSPMDDMLAFMLSRDAVTEVRRVSCAWRMAERSGVVVFAGGCLPARLRAMLSTESVRMSDMLMEDAAMCGEEGVEDVA